MKYFLIILTALLMSASMARAADCTACHVSPPHTADPATDPHDQMTMGQDCTACHGHKGNGPNHMNGKVDYIGGDRCDSCHDYDTMGTAPNKTWGTFRNANYGGNGQGNGAHAKHIEMMKSSYGIVNLDAAADYAAGFGQGNAAKVCGVCHTNQKSQHMDYQRQINFGY